MKFTGERFIPGELDNTQMAYEHWQRYIFAGNLSKNKTVIDIACGEGYGADFLANNAKRVYGIDISKEAVEYAANKYTKSNLSFQCGSVDRLEFENNSVDLVVSFETIEHVDEATQKKFLNEVKKVLKEDGIFVASCPNKRIATDLAWELWNYRNEFHIKEYYIDEFRSFLSNYFKNIKFFYQRTENSLVLSSEGTKGLEVIFNENQNYDDCQNIIAICSNSEIEELEFNSIVFEKSETYQQKMRIISDLQKSNATLIDDVNKLNAEIVKFNNELNKIYNSKGWKVLSKLYKIKGKFIK